MVFCFSLSDPNPFNDRVFFTSGLLDKINSYEENGSHFCYYLTLTTRAVSAWEPIS